MPTELSQDLRRLLGPRLVYFAVGAIHGHPEAFSTARRLIESINARTILLGNYAQPDSSEVSLPVFKAMEAAWRHNHFWFFLRSKADIERWSLPRSPAPIFRLPERIVEGLSKRPEERLHEFRGHLRDEYETTSFFFRAVLDARIMRERRPFLCSEAQFVTPSGGRVINLNPAGGGEGWLQVAALDERSGRVLALIEVSPDGSRHRERFHADPDEPLRECDVSDIVCAKGGDPVRFTGREGYPETSYDGLEGDQVYTVHGVDPFWAHSFVYLQEFPGRTFNSNGFERVV